MTSNNKSHGNGSADNQVRYTPLTNADSEHMHSQYNMDDDNNFFHPHYHYQHSTPFVKPKSTIAQLPSNNNNSNSNSNNNNNAASTYHSADETPLRALHDIHSDDADHQNNNHSTMSPNTPLSNRLDEPAKTNRIGVARLIGLTYLNVCGGPFGSEQSVSAGGPLAALLATLLVPLLWSLPVALMTTELAAAIPHDGSFVLWVNRSFGHFWAFQTAWWNMCANEVTAAVFAKMVTDYFVNIYEISAIAKKIIHALVTSSIIGLNIRGSELVGSASIILTALLLMPFIIMICLGIGFIKDPSIFLKSSPSPDWGVFLSIVLWNQSGWDGASLIAGEVENPAVTYQKGMFATVTLTALTYFAPILVGVGVVHHNIMDWDDGYFATVANKIAKVSLGLNGNWLEYWIAMAGICSAFGMFLSQLCLTSRTLYAVANLGLAPRIFTTLHSRFKTPWVSILFQGVIVLIITDLLSFDVLVQVMVIFYSLGLLLKLASFVYLRLYEPNLDRPYRLPLSAWGASILFISPALLALLSIALNSGMTLIISSIMFSVGGILYFVMQYLKRRTDWFLTSSELL